MSRKLIDGSRLIVEGAVRAGAQAYSAYPITPANRIYFHAVDRIPQILKAPDEITALQWACGISATGVIPMTATSRPGFSLMVESVDMAFMMELPVLIVIVQRLGPSTGSATTGAQGDVSLLHRMISGGYDIPVITPSSLKDCYVLSGKALGLAVKLRTPVVLLTSKEMIETERSVDLEQLPDGLYSLIIPGVEKKSGQIVSVMPRLMVCEIRKERFQPFRIEVPLYPLGKSSLTGPPQKQLSKESNPQGTPYPFSIPQSEGE